MGRAREDEGGGEGGRREGDERTAHAGNST